MGWSENGLLIAATLLVKNDANVSAVSLVGGGGGGGVEWSHDLKVEKRFRLSVASLTSCKKQPLQLWRWLKRTI